MRPKSGGAYLCGGTSTLAYPFLPWLSCLALSAGKFGLGASFASGAVSTCGKEKGDRVSFETRDPAALRSACAAVRTSIVLLEAPALTLSLIMEKFTEKN